MDFDRIFTNSWNRMRSQLFAAFDAAKWACLAFVAWVSTFVTGVSLGLPLKDPQSALPVIQSIYERFGSVGFFVIISGCVLVLGLIALVLMWIGSRGQFMFVDNVVRGRAEVAEPWKRFREPGNAFFKLYVWLVSIPVVAIMLLIMAALLVFMPNFAEAHMPDQVRLIPWVLALLGLGLFWLVWSLAMLLFRDFGVPVMMVTGCSAGEAGRRVCDIVRNRPADSMLFVLIRVGIAIILGLCMIVVSLATCCVGALPYVNTVLTLPVLVFRQSFVLECLRELAPEYNLLGGEPPPLELAAQE